MSYPRVNTLTGRLEIPNEYDQNQPSFPVGTGEDEDSLVQGVQASRRTLPVTPTRAKLSTGGKIRELFDDVIFSMARGMSNAAQHDNATQSKTAAFAGAMMGPQVQEDRELIRKQASEQMELNRARIQEIRDRSEMVTLPSGAQVSRGVAEKLVPEYVKQQGRLEVIGKQGEVRGKLQDDQQAFTSAENDKKLTQRKGEQAFKERHAGLRLELTKALQEARTKASLVSRGSAEARLKIQQQNADLAREKFQAYERHKATAEKLAQDSFEDMKRHRQAGDDIRADLLEMKGQRYLEDAEAMVGPMDELLSFVGVTTDDKKAAQEAQARFGNTGKGGAPAPATPGEMEIQDHNGVIYQRRKGSNDAWKRR